MKYMVDIDNTICYNENSNYEDSKPDHVRIAKLNELYDKGHEIHYWTARDEGPIIEQDIAHVSHASTPEDLIALGRDIERRVLAKAVRLYAQDRIFIVGQRTVVFS